MEIENPPPEKGIKAGEGSRKEERRGFGNRVS